MQNKKPTICFATMCKNEQHCIEETLESVYKYIDYWIICDTGSTDKTCEIIKNFFKAKNINGELFIDEWVGFGFNKTKMFERCYKKTDYIIHMDADDVLCGEFSLSYKDDYANKIAYEVKMKRGNYQYYNLVLFNNQFKWKICGVAHTIANCSNNVNNLETGKLSDKEFYVLSRDTGNRSSDPQKYLKDAILLQNQFFDTLFKDDDDLNNRSVFYTAQSYMDCGDYLNAIKWYSLYLKLKNTQSEEVFESYLRIGICLKKINSDESTTLNYFNISKNMFKDRAEPYYELGKFYFEHKKYYQAFVHFKIAKNKNYNDVVNKYMLFINENAYNGDIDNCLINTNKFMLEEQVK
jgi:hypothetical protein